MINIDFKKASQVATDTVFKILTIFVILALVIGTARIFLNMGASCKSIFSFLNIF